MKKIILTLLIMAAFSISMLSAKEKVALDFSLGAAGQEETKYSFSTISSDTLSLPYTVINFYPNLHLGAEFPLASVGSNSDFCLYASYDFAWYFYQSGEAQSDSYIAVLQQAHLISLLGEILYSKGAMEFTGAGGLGFGINPSKSVIGSAMTDEMALGLHLVTRLKASYKISKHIAASCALVFDYEMMDFLQPYTLTTSTAGVRTSTTNENSKSITMGKTPFIVTPQVGLQYRF